MTHDEAYKIAIARAEEGGQDAMLFSLFAHLLEERSILEKRCALQKYKIEQLEKEIDWLLRIRKCRTSLQHMCMPGVCPAIVSPTKSDADIKPCGVLGSPYYTEDECVNLWRKAASKALQDNAK